MVQQRLVQRRADDHRRAAPDRLGDDGQRQAVGDAVRELVERVEAARREQHHPARRPGPDRQIEIGFDDLHPRDIREFARRDHARGVRRRQRDDRRKSRARPARAGARGSAPPSSCRSAPGRRHRTVRRRLRCQNSIIALRVPPLRYRAAASFVFLPRSARAEFIPPNLRCALARHVSSGLCLPCQNDHVAATNIGTRLDASSRRRCGSSRSSAGASGSGINVISGTIRRSARLCMRTSGCHASRFSPTPFA